MYRSKDEVLALFGRDAGVSYSQVYLPSLLDQLDLGELYYQVNGKPLLLNASTGGIFEQFQLSHKGRKNYVFDVETPFLHIKIRQHHADSFWTYGNYNKLSQDSKRYLDDGLKIMAVDYNCMKETDADLTYNQMYNRSKRNEEFYRMKADGTKNRAMSICSNIGDCILVCMML